MKKFVLASASPRRKELLKLIIPEFSVVPSDFTEKIPDNTEIDLIPEYFAVRKAESVSKNTENSVVIGCDTVVIADGKILGKPKDKTDAYNMLKALSGTTHKVITGCAVIFDNRTVSFSSVTFVKFYELSEEDVLNYVSSEEPYDKAGAYAIQGKASLFIEKIDGDYFNVVGLPVAKLNSVLKNNNLL